jgi:hypothetical protein
MNIEISANTPAGALVGKAANVAQKAGRRIKRGIAPNTKLSYPGQADDGEHFAEVYLTWFFGRGTVMWRARFESAAHAQAAAKEHAQFLDSVLPTHYWAENWSGRRYKERHEYGISWGVGEASSRAQEELESIWRTALPGQAEA